jgi:hypothetical protein
MSNAITLPSARQPVTEVDSAGRTYFTRPWFLFFQTVFNRIGGANAPDNGELTGTSSADPELAATLYALQNELRAAPPVVAPAPADVLTPELAWLREEIAVARKFIQDIQQGTSL